MKLVSETLFDLIQSLEQKERRYFRRQVTRMNGGVPPKYLLLFDSLSQMEPFDLETLQQELSGEGILSNLSASATKLTKQVAKWIIEYQLPGRADLANERRLEMVNLFFERGQFYLAGKQCHPGLQTAQKLGDPHRTNQWLRWIRRLNRKIKAPLVPEEKLQALENEAHEQVISETHLLRIYDQVFLISDSKGKLDQGSLETSQWEAQLAKLGRQALSFDGELALESIRLYLARITGETASAWLASKAVIEIWHRFPERIAIHTQRYIRAVSNYCNYSAEIGNEAAILEIEERILRTPLFRQQDREILQTVLLNISLRASFAKRQYDEGLILLNKRKGLLEKRSAQAMSLLFNTALLHLYRKDHSRARRNNLQLMNLKKGRIQAEMYVAVLLLDSVLLYEIQLMDILHHRVRSLRRHLKGDQPEWIAALVKFLERAGDYRLRTPLSQEFIDLKSSFRSSGGQELVGHGGFMLWIEQKIEESSESHSQS